MNSFSSFGIHLKHLMSRFTPKTFQIRSFTMSLYRDLAFHVNPFYLQLVYFMVFSLFGFVGLKFLKPRTSVPPNNFDLFYTSVSASTVSSMTAVEMEVFSNSHLVLMTFLMFVGGEVFTSMLGLLFSYINLTQKTTLKNRGSSTRVDPAIPIQNATQIELGLASLQNHQTDTDFVDNEKIDKLKHRSLKCLVFVVLGCLVVLHMIGSGLVSSYISLLPSARQVLRNKGIRIQTFSVFTIVSTFASCGFVPTNENMIVFKKNSGLLLLILPFVFLGNTLYPPFLRFVIWVLEKVTKREEFSYIQRNYKEMGYDHMLSGLHCWLLLATVVGLNLVQMVLFCSMEWRSENMEGLSNYEKFVASLFQISNARHAGESVVDLSTVSSAILVMFVVMMYLPPYTTYLPIRDRENDDTKKEKRSLVECVLFSQLSYLVIFIILICITESKSLREDPLNFNVLNITLEVISAYGNVGFSTGYSCKRQLKSDGSCRDLWVGFSGRWSNKGKFILILVMFFGRLKKFNMKGGKAWDLS